MESGKNLINLFAVEIEKETLVVLCSISKLYKKQIQMTRAWDKKEIISHS